jgi:hypothetical protein
MPRKVGHLLNSQMKTAIIRCHELIRQMDPELSNRQIDDKLAHVFSVVFIF